MRKFYLLSCLAFIVFLVSACEELTPANGVNGMNMLIEIRDATTAECPNGGQAFVQGYDLTGGGKVTQIVSTTLNCNKTEIIAQAESCSTCHQSQNDALVPSPHLQRAFMDASLPWVGSSCLTCHTGGIAVADANLKSIGATSGLICTSCHNNTLATGFGKIHKTVGVNHLITNGFINVTMCANEACHGNPPGHIGQGHPYPFAQNISASVKKATYVGGDGTTAEADATRFNVHGKTTDRGVCTPCHVGGYFEAVVVGVPSLERRATGTVIDGKTVWTTTGGASKFVENQRVTAFGSTDRKSGFNYTAFQKGFGTWNSGTDAYDSIDVSATNISCTACHDKHSTELIGKEVKDTDGAVVFSKEFMTCTSCHVTNVDAVKNDNGIGYNYTIASKYVPSEDKLVADGTNWQVTTLTTEDVDFHGNNFASTNARGFAHTHFKGKAYQTYTASTTDAKVVTITDAMKTAGPLEFTGGYNINLGAPNACTSCHDAHYSTKFAKDGDPDGGNVIAQNWAKSKHATYNNAAMIGRVDGYSSTCNRCHNGMAFAYSIGGVAPADLNKEAFKTTGSVMAQTITCITCHDASFGADPKVQNGFNAIALSGGSAVTAKLRQWTSKGVALTEIDPVWVQDKQTQKTLADGSKVDLTVLATAKITQTSMGEKSMVCTQCHSGRSTGEFIVESWVGGVNPLTVALTAYPHYMNAVGTINKNGPYNFKDKPYAGTTDTHPSIPLKCVDCHDVKLHTFKVFTNTAGEPISASAPESIAGVTSKNNTCTICHGTPSGFGNTGSITAKKGYDEAINQLKAQLAGRGKFYNPNGVAITGSRYPTFWVTSPDGTIPVTSWASSEELGVAYNILYFTKYDTAGWAHGVKYTKQIMFDSMQALGGAFTGDALAWIPTRP